jgi:hypothetical protein
MSSYQRVMSVYHYSKKCDKNFSQIMCCFWFKEKRRVMWSSIMFTLISKKRMNFDVSFEILKTWMRFETSSVEFNSMLKSSWFSCDEDELFSIFLTYLMRRFLYWFIIFEFMYVMLRSFDLNVSTLLTYWKVWKFLFESDEAWFSRYKKKKLMKINDIR